MTADHLTAALAGLGGYQPQELPARPLGSVAYLLAVVIVSYLERLQFRLRALEGSRWWASNGRDVLNTLALLFMIAGLHLIGFSGPLSLCIAATIVIVLSALQLELDKHRHQAWWSLAVGLGLSAPVLLFPAQTDALFTRLIGALYRA